MELTLTDPELLLILRRRAGLTHQDLASQAKCTRALVTAAETGKASPLIVRALLAELQGDTHGNHSRNHNTQDLQDSDVRSAEVGQDADSSPVS